MKLTQNQSLAELEGVLAGADILKNRESVPNPYKRSETPGRYRAWLMGRDKTLLRHFSQKLCR
jgi:hypothetical protein